MDDANPKPVAGRRAIVTGSSGLIGSAIVDRLRLRGWDVAGFDLRDTIGRSGHVDCDVGDERSVAAAFRQLGWDRLDLLVNNAGIADPVNGPIEDMALVDWRRVTDSHLTGAFLMVRAAVRLLAPGGAILNMASTRAFQSEPQTEAYAASKGGIVALTHALAVSLGPRDIRVNAIAPGWITDEEGLRDIDHAQHPAGRVGRADDICEAVGYLADARFVTGTVLTVDGGMTRRMIYAE